MVKPKNVVIELMPAWIDVTVLRAGDEPETRRLPVTPESDPASWIKVLRRCAVSLREHVDELGIAGAEATVLYRSPTQVIDIMGFPVSASRQAIDAAELGCIDALPYSSLSAVTRALILGRDAHGEEKATHVLVAAERDDVAETIFKVLGEAGLRVGSMTPIEGAVMARFFRGELTRNEPSRATLYLGDHTSWFVVTDHGRLLYARRIDLGIESLVMSMTRPLYRSTGEEPVELTIDDARRVLHRFGVPLFNAEIDPKKGLRGEHMIPLVQPVLQRFIVEIRQSLRFGVDEEYRTKAVFDLKGPGSVLPRVGTLLAEELDLELLEHDPEADGAPVPEMGERTEALIDRRTLGQLNLLPRDESRRRRTHRIRRWLWTGAAAAILVIAADGTRQHLRLEAVRDNAEMFAAQVQDLEALEKTRAKLEAVLGARTHVESSIRSELGRRADYRATMKEISRITPESVRLGMLRIDRMDRTSVVRLGGSAFRDDDGRTELQRFIESIKDSPLFTTVVLQNVHLAAIGGRDGEQFEATFEIVSVPQDPVEGAVAMEPDP